MQTKNVVTVGGGTGSFVILQALKSIKGISIKAIVTTADDGGIAKKERDEFGILPQSDVRKALIALSDDKKNYTIRELFTYRFSKGLGIEGATLGNLFLAALTDIKKSQYKAIQEIEKLLNINGEVIPISLDKTNILITLENKIQILGETHLDNVFWDGTKKIKKIELIPKAKIFKKAAKEIEKADYIFITPGDLYGSVIVNFCVDGFKKAINKSKAKIIYTCNLVTKYGQSYDYSAKDHITDIEKYLGKKLDIVILNKAQFPTEVMVNYAKEKSRPVTHNKKDLRKYKLIIADLVNEEIEKPKKGDKIKRSLIRHDLKTLNEIYTRIIYNKI